MSHLSWCRSSLRKASVILYCSFAWHNKRITNLPFKTVHKSGLCSVGLSQIVKFNPIVLLFPKYHWILVIHAAHLMFFTIHLFTQKLLYIITIKNHVMQERHFLFKWNWAFAWMLLYQAYWRLFGAEPLSKPMMDSYKMNHWEQMSMNFESKFHPRKWTWICCLWDGGRFASASTPMRWIRLVFRYLHG